MITRITGARLSDDIFTFPWEGKETVWNVTKLASAARSGFFGKPSTFPTSGMKPPNYSLGFLDKEKIERFKLDPAILNSPAIAIQNTQERFLKTGAYLLVFADGQHRMTARWELGLPDFQTYVVPPQVEHQFRVLGFPQGREL